MRKADRPHPMGGTYGKRAEAGWWNWHVNRGRVPGLGSPPSSYREFEKWRRSKSWRRTL